MSAAARELADRFGRAVRVVFSREDVVRLGPKRPPIAASAWYDEGTVTVKGVTVGEVGTVRRAGRVAVSHRRGRSMVERARAGPRDVFGAPCRRARRARGAPRRCLRCRGRRPSITCARRARRARVARHLRSRVARWRAPRARGARVATDDDGTIDRVTVRVAAGDPLDEVVLRSYAIGAAHMAIGWVLNESLTIDPESGEIHDLTIRSFGVVRAQDTPRDRHRDPRRRRAALATRVRRGVRRGRGGGMERDHACRRRAPRRVPRVERACRPPATPLTSPRPPVRPSPSRPSSS